jgi:hypothetical protein
LDAGLVAVAEGPVREPVGSGGLQHDLLAKAAIGVRPEKQVLLASGTFPNSVDSHPSNGRLQAS